MYKHHQCPTVNKRNNLGAEIQLKYSEDWTSEQLKKMQNSLHAQWYKEVSKAWINVTLSGVTEAAWRKTQSNDKKRECLDQNKDRIFSRVAGGRVSPVS